MNYMFVPKCQSVTVKDLLKLKKFMDNNDQICVLTGAGISTESGIPDYRSPEVGLYARSNRKPILYKDFCTNESVRKRYWARNYIGWPRFSSIEPNNTHKILKYLEDIGKIKCIITQNVDNLHAKAGSKNVIELHGTAFTVMCLNCDNKIKRSDFQILLGKLNPSMKASITMIRPDGDVDLSQDVVEKFIIPDCQNCSGIMKPDIVFFGDNVSRKTVEDVQHNILHSDSLLVLGTSLSTYSGYRIILQAVTAKKPIGLVNIGKSRADEYAHIKIEGRCGDVLYKIVTLNNQCVN